MTAMCDHRLAGGVLVCTRPDPHDAAAVGGHTYESTSSADAEPRGEDW